MPASVGANSLNSTDGSLPRKFPAGLRVLAVDDDRACLLLLATMLKQCDYEVTACTKAEAALSLLRENKNGYDVVISDVHMPDMDGFKLLEHIGLEMSLPVIMMSADDSKKVVMKGVTHGACDYLIKPVPPEALRNIWQHVVRKRKYEWKDLEPSTSLDDGNQQQIPPEDTVNSSSANQGHNSENTKRSKDEEDEDADQEKDGYCSRKKYRVTWTPELHQQFVQAIYHIGIDKAVPKKILDVMNVPGITRENVASHLQKFRLYLKKLAAQQSGVDNQDASYGSYSELDLHPLAAIGQVSQLPGQRLATIQSLALARSANPTTSVPVPLVDQTNTYFAFHNPKLRYMNNNINNISKQMTPLPPSLVGMHNNSQPLIPIPGQSHTYNHALRQPSLPVLPASQDSSVLDFIGNHKTEPNVNGFPLRGCLGVPPVMSTSTLQQESYGVLKNVNKKSTHDWGLQGVSPTFEPSQHRNYMQGGLNVGQHNYGLGRNIMGNSNKVSFSPGEGSGSHIALVTMDESHQQFHPPLEESSDDLLTAILAQQQQEEGIGHVESEFTYNLDSERKGDDGR
ncbi:two-component response regulator ARR2-like [Bidens hawaiensis]|uniref:two-component response regulator ARR2-like n=1 Tax=Bidens hawaiensis TaxID=980011 RepID=UPI00404A70DB